MSTHSRYGLALFALLSGCESVFGAFLGDNSCVVNPGLCSSGQRCDAQRGQCVPTSPLVDGGTDMPSGDLAVKCAGTCGTDEWCSPLSNSCEALPTLYSVSGDGQGTVWAVGDGGLIVIWNNTATPLYLRSSPAVTLRGVSAIPGMKQAWIVGDQGTILLATTTQVAAATVVGSVGAKTFEGVWTRDPQSADAVGLTQTTWRYDDNLIPANPKSWSKVNVTVGQDFRAIGGCETTNPGLVPVMRALGSNGQIFKWSGTNWSNTSEQSMTTSQLLGTTCFNENEVWAVGMGQTIVHFDGSTWSTVASPGTTRQNLSGVSGSSIDDVWAVGDVNTVLRWDGSTWTSQPCSTCKQSDYWSVWAGNSGESVWITGTRGVVSVWNRTTSQWQDQSLPH